MMSFMGASDLNYKLEILALSNNRLTRLPDHIYRLHKLESLHLAHNRLEHLPHDICRLKKLQFLDVSCNRLHTIPPYICQLHRLVSLHAVFNNIEELPEEICDMTQLHSLWLGYNRIRFLPQNFGKLNNLQEWSEDTYISCMFDGNPLLDPPLEVFRQGPEKVRLYFADVQSNLEPDEDDRLHSHSTSDGATIASPTTNHIDLLSATTNHSPSRSPTTNHSPAHSPTTNRIRAARSPTTNRIPAARSPTTNRIPAARSPTTNRIPAARSPTTNRRESPHPSTSAPVSRIPRRLEIRRSAKSKEESTGSPSAQSGLRQRLLGVPTRGAGIIEPRSRSWGGVPRNVPRSGTAYPK